MRQVSQSSIESPDSNICKRDSPVPHIFVNHTKYLMADFQSFASPLRCPALRLSVIFYYQIFSRTTVVLTMGRFCKVLLKFCRGFNGWVMSCCRKERKQESQTEREMNSSIKLRVGKMKANAEDKPPKQWEIAQYG
ncbi:unnamed protein product [Heterobilharzia americana]|nr:unnamed protein product [Heterobilharzia americana]